jgi:LIM-domain binding protein.
MRSPLTETIYRVQGMIAYVRENLSTDEYMLFLDLLVPQPEPEPEKPAKKKSRKPRGKSARASSMAETLNKNLKQQRRDTSGVESLCMTCDYDSDHNIHHLESMVGYHPFTPPAPTAAQPSSASNGVGSTTASSVDEMVSAGDAQVASAGGD